MKVDSNADGVHGVTIAMYCDDDRGTVGPAACVLQTRLHALIHDSAVLAEHVSDPMVIGNREWGGENAKVVLEHYLRQIPRHVNDIIPIPIGLFRGLRFGVICYPDGSADVYLQGDTTRQMRVQSVSISPVDVVRTLEHLACTYEVECEFIRRRMERMVSA